MGWSLLSCLTQQECVTEELSWSGLFCQIHPFLSNVLVSRALVGTGHTFPHVFRAVLTHIECPHVRPSRFHTFLQSTSAPLWWGGGRAEAWRAAWLSFYQISEPFKWEMAELRRDRQTKSPLSFRPAFSSPPLLSLSFSESTAAVICYTGGVKRKKFSQDSLQGHILQPVLGIPQGTGNLVVSSPPPAFLFVLQ